jgi:hypothetical protein
VHRHQVAQPARDSAGLTLNPLCPQPCLPAPEFGEFSEPGENQPLLTIKSQTHNEISYSRNTGENAHAATADPFCFCEPRSHYATQCWDSRCEPPCPALVFTFTYILPCPVAGNVHLAGLGVFTPRHGSVRHRDSLFVL